MCVCLSVCVSVRVCVCLSVCVCVYLEVDWVHLVSQGVGSPQGVERGGGLGVVLEVLHQGVEGTHHPPGVPPQLPAALQLQGVRHVPELTEEPAGARSAPKQPGRNRNAGG